MGQVVVKGVRGNKKVSRELSLPVTVLSRNAMDWLQPKSLAAFITNRDKVIDSFAKDVVQKIKYVENVNISLMQTMGLFAGLRELGFKYVKDPAGSPGRPGLDMVQYPRETLKLRTGDCDDTSVLMAALTTSLGIKTAVISYPDHVLIMINTEVFDKNRTALGADGKKMISHRGTLWVPVETTMIEKGFVAAWDEAIAEFLNAVKAGEAIQIFEVEEAWKNYQAVWLAGNQKVPDLKGILVEKAGATLQKHVVDSWRTKLDELKKLRVLSIEERNLMGVLYARLGEYDRAMKIFKKITRDNNIPKWLNNYGASIILSGSEEKALKILNKADSKEKLIGVAINRAICFYLQSQTKSNIEPFIKALKEASALLPAGESLETYLGMNIMAKSLNKGANVTPKKSLINKRQMRELIRERVLKSKNKPQNKRTQPTDNNNQKLVYGGIRGADPTQVAEVMDLLYWYEK
jgi:tetratricopeptide (TPR) repeat protein